MKRKRKSDLKNMEQSELSLDDWADTDLKTEAAKAALLARRPISLRLQIYLGFILVFILAVGIAGVMLYTMYEVEDRLKLLQVVNDFVIEIDQARRFEKNYFLYGTDLDESLEIVYQADFIFERQNKEFRNILGEKNYRIIDQNLESYQSLLERLSKLDVGADEPDSLNKDLIERDLRRHGHQMLSLSQDLMNKLRVSVSDVLLRSRMIHVYFLVFLLIFIIFNGYILGNRILATINRFSRYAQRIAAGDFSPIMPKRRFRDEFTELAIAINHMIEMLERREDELIQLHKVRAVGTLTAGIAHELNNPLNNIMLSAHLLTEDYENLSDADKKEIMNDIVEETNRSRNIISNLLDFARQSSSQVEPLDLVKLLEDTIRLASNQIKLSGIKIEFHAPANLPQIHGDVQQLRQVFLNLLLNAVDASSKGGKIQVFVLPADEPNYVAVKIMDFGTGIPEHILHSIFDPFFTTKVKGKGTGLGLSVSQGIITKHGGRIQVHSREKKGSTFTVTLPVTTIPAEINSTHHSAA
ncbi:MAG: HAMP domain-containing sensor histidine kinase [Desulfobacterales bacterium]